MRGIWYLLSIQQAVRLLCRSQSKHTHFLSADGVPHLLLGPLPALFLFNFHEWESAIIISVLEMRESDSEFKGLSWGQRLVSAEGMWARKRWVHLGHPSESLGQLTESQICRPASGVPRERPRLGLVIWEMYKVLKEADVNEKVRTTGLTLQCLEVNSPALHRLQEIDHSWIWSTFLKDFVINVQASSFWQRVQQLPGLWASSSWQNSVFALFTSLSVWRDYLFIS